MGQTVSIPSPAPTVSQVPSAAPEVSQSESSADTIPVLFKWTHGGQKVCLTGTFNDWATNIPMVRSGQEFYQILDLPKSVHQYKFIVDDEWKFSADLPMIHDSHGIINNYIDTVNYEPYQPVTVPDILDSAPLEDYQDILISTPENSQILTEPFTAPVLLVKSALIAGGIDKDLSVSSSLLEPFSCNERTKPLLAIHSNCQHLYLGDNNVNLVNLRFKEKVSLQVIVEPSSEGQRENFLLKRFSRMSSPERKNSVHVSREISDFTD
jgi:Glycogen recognition site of AMP-activated protein kinase